MEGGPKATMPLPQVIPRRAQNRFEVKYLVPTTQVPDIIGELSPYLKRDRNAETENGYRVMSVYWDTPAHLFFWEKIEGVDGANRLHDVCLLWNKNRTGTGGSQTPVRSGKIGRLETFPSSFAGCDKL